MVAEKGRFSLSERASFWMLFVSNFFIFASHNILGNLPVYLQRLGMNHTFIGFFMNMNALGLILFVVVFGHKAERWGKKTLLLFAYMLEIMGYVGMFFFARHVGMLVVFRLVNSLSFAVGFTVNAALAFEFLPREKHTSGIALFGISGILSNPIAVFVADRVVALASERMVFVVAALFALMALVTMIPMREGRQEIREDGHFFAVLFRRELVPFFLLGMMLGGAFSVFVTFLPTATERIFGVSRLSLYLTAYAVTAILFRIFVSERIAKVNGKRLLAVGFALIGLAMVNACFLRVLPQVAMVGVLYGVAHSIVYPLLSSTVVRKSLPRDTYLVNSVYIVSYIFGSIVISTIVGRIGDIWGEGWIFFWMAVVVFCCAGVIEAALVRERWWLREE